MQHQRINSHNNQYTCTDIPNWTDLAGDDCSWYEDPVDLEQGYEVYDDGDTRCKLFGNLFPDPDTFTTAQQACCTCGGGDLHEKYCQNVVLRSTGEEWTDSDNFPCAWYEDEPDFYFGNEYNAYDTRCYIFGSQFVNAGYTAQTACCACGGGEYYNNKNGEELSSLCTDYDGFVDGDGNACTWYAHSDDNDDDPFGLSGDGFSRCYQYGHTRPNLNMNARADDACCVCGGGYRVLPDPIMPSTIPSNVPSVAPSRAPSIEPTNTNTMVGTPPMAACADEENWTDASGEGCDWYSVDISDNDNGASDYMEGDTRCSVFGAEFSNPVSGLSANNACCVCKVEQANVYASNHPTFAPSIVDDKHNSPGNGSIMESSLSSDGASSSTNIVIGAAVGIGAGLIIVGTVVYAMIVRRNKLRSRTTTTTTNANNINNGNNYNDSALTVPMEGTDSVPQEINVHHDDGGENNNFNSHDGAGIIADVDTVMSPLTDVASYAVPIDDVKTRVVVRRTVDEDGNVIQEYQERVPVGAVPMLE